MWTCHCSTHPSVRLLLFGLQQRSPFGPPCGYIGQITKSSKCCCPSTYWIPQAWPHYPTPEGSTLASNQQRTDFTPYVPLRQLRSTASLDLTERRFKTDNYGRRAFSRAAPLVWNSLPNDVRSATSLSQFRSSLKTHLFRTTFVSWECLFQCFYHSVFDHVCKRHFKSQYIIIIIIIMHTIPIQPLSIR